MGLKKCTNKCGQNLGTDVANCTSCGAVQSGFTDLEKYMPDELYYFMMALVAIGVIAIFLPNFT